MRRYDLSPLFRSTVGFDRMSNLLESALSADDASLAYPPYNIEKLSDDAYRITMAVAGFGPDQLDIVSRENSLIVSGKARKDEEGTRYLHRGIAGRAFERRFQLADHIKVKAASLDNGLLHIELAREIPEAMRPRTIRIETGSPARTLEQQAA